MRLFCVLALALLLGCETAPTAPVDVHILPAANHGCEIVCKDGICTITCPFKYGCKSEGECYCTIENGRTAQPHGLLPDVHRLPAV